jgi:UDP-N-acetylmuramoylalanine--D-glutamate ligase
MAKNGAKVTVTDIKQKNELNDSIKAVGDLKIEFELGRHNHEVFLASELIVVSPGVPLSLQPIQDAKLKGIPITSEIELAASMIEVPVVAITGTNGKTTVTTLIGEMFKADGRNVFVGGNIGKPLIDLITEGTPADVAVVELSSFQLESLEKFVPAVAVFTNITPDHMDRYADMEMYIEAKKRLLKACDKNSYVVLNYDDPVVARFAEGGIGKQMFYTRRNPISVDPGFSEKFWGCYFDAENRRIVSKVTATEEIYDLSQFKMIGEHNRENMMAAICAVRSLGVQPKSIQKVINEFKGIHHRLEFVRKKDGVFFFNDSKATNVSSLKTSLKAFQTSPVILISGGRDKDSDFTVLQDIVRTKCKLLILLGEAKERMNRDLGEVVETYMVGTFEEAVLMAYQKSRRGDIILLSPGCKSFDMFRNYEERGEYFKKLVSQF